MAASNICVYCGERFLSGHPQGGKVAVSYDGITLSGHYAHRQCAAAVAPIQDTADTVTTARPVAIQPTPGHHLPGPDRQHTSRAPGPNTQLFTLRPQQGFASQIIGLDQTSQSGGRPSYQQVAWRSGERWDWWADEVFMAEVHRSERATKKEP
jgi:hypothetical protein